MRVMKDLLSHMLRSTRPLLFVWLGIFPLSHFSATSNTGNTMPHQSLLQRSSPSSSGEDNPTAAGLTEAVHYSAGHGPTPQPHYTLLVGGYAGSISVIQFDERTRKLSNSSSLSNAIVGESPSWITPSADGKHLYSSNEVDTVDGLNATGSIGSYRLTYQTPQSAPSFPTVASLVKARSSPSPVHLDLSPNQRNLIVASYTGGTASRYELNHAHSFKTPDTPSQIFTYHAEGPNKLRQSQSYIHQARYDPTGRIATFVDLGGDKVYMHSVDPKTGELSPLHTIELKPGTGPRHLTFVVVNQVRTDIYLICELSNEMLFIELTYSSPTCICTDIRQTLSTLPAGVPQNNTYGAAEVVVSSDGRFVYGTNRQTDFTRPPGENSVVIFDRDSVDGRLSPSPRFASLEATGPTPRHISLSPDTEERWVAVVGQQSNKLSIYSRDHQSGGLEFVDSIAVALPTVAQFLPVSHHGAHQGY